MKSCNNCGAFYNKKCDYCGWEDDDWKAEDTFEFVTVKITGNNNDVLIINDQGSTQKVFIIKGNNHDIQLKCNDTINLIVKGVNNDIRMKEGIRSALIVEGNNNCIT